MAVKHPDKQFQDQLEQQFGFLSRSCIAYDKGDQDDAIRIATTIRVLIHNTKSSTSLLKHLNATTIDLHTTVEDVQDHWVGYRGMGMISMSSSGAHDYVPALQMSPISYYVPVSKWWDQVVFVTDKARLSRRKIVLAATNQDGGAHVDASLDPIYAQSREPGFGGFIERTEGVKVELIPLKNAHFVALRQMGYELLTSPALNALRSNA
jgi:hypothetical protein